MFDDLKTIFNTTDNDSFCGILLNTIGMDIESIEDSFFMSEFEQKNTIQNG